MFSSEKRNRCRSRKGDTHPSARKITTTDLGKAMFSARDVIVIDLKCVRVV